MLSLRRCSPRVKSLQRISAADQGARLSKPFYLDEPCDFDGGFLQLPNNGRDVARQVPGRRLSPLLGPFGSRVRRVGLEAKSPGREIVSARPAIILCVPATSLGERGRLAEYTRRSFIGPPLQ